MVSQEDRHVILRYLLSTEGLEYIVGLPLLRMLNGNHCALGLPRTDSDCYMLLSPWARKLLGAYDPDAIAVDDLAKSDVFCSQFLATLSFALRIRMKLSSDILTQLCRVQFSPKVISRSF